VAVYLEHQGIAEVLEDIKIPRRLAIQDSIGNKSPWVCCLGLESLLTPEVGGMVVAIAALHH
jgi:hypothetical protein